MNRFKLMRTPIAGVVRVDRHRLIDARGFFSRLFCSDELAEAGLGFAVAQINHTLTHRQGAARGLHFQHPPHAEVKLVSCLRGAVFDVAVDVRVGSQTFLQWHAEVLSAENARSLLIPQGCAHGFQALTDDCELVYLHSHRYEPSAEGALNLLDPRLSIPWPEPLTELSDRDRGHSLLGAEYQGIEVGTPR